MLAEKKSSDKKSALQTPPPRVSDKKSALQTPPPRVSGPTPASTPQPKESSSSSGAKKKGPVAPPPERPPPATEGAKQNRLRRLCEKKPSGRCNVPPEIHQKWLHASRDERDAMIEELDAVSWSKDHLVNSCKHSGNIIWYILGYHQWLYVFTCFHW